MSESFRVINTIENYKNLRKNALAFFADAIVFGALIGFLTKLWPVGIGVAVTIVVLSYIKKTRKILSYIMTVFWAVLGGLFGNEFSNAWYIGIIIGILAGLISAGIHLYGYIEVGRNMKQEDNFREDMSPYEIGQTLGREMYQNKQARKSKKRN